MNKFFFLKLSVLLLGLLLLSAARNAQLKTRLTTAEWRYDSLQMHMDTMAVLNNQAPYEYSRLVSHE